MRGLWRSPVSHPRPRGASIGLWAMTLALAVAVGCAGDRGGAPDETSRDEVAERLKDGPLVLNIGGAADIVVADRAGAVDSITATGAIAAGIGACSRDTHPGEGVTIVYCHGDVALPLELRLRWGSSRRWIMAEWGKKGAAKCVAMEDYPSDAPAVQRWRIELLKTTADHCSLVIVRVQDE